MSASDQSVAELTAKDLMTTPLLLRPEMSLREAARLLRIAQVRGAPVVDAEGKCVGILTTSDLFHWACTRQAGAQPSELPLTCSFLRKSKATDGGELYACSLPPESCVFQVSQRQAGGAETLVCSEPHAVPTDWQVVETEQLPVDEVRHYMTPGPVTARADTLVSVLARRMQEAGIHRVVIVDEMERVIGIVTRTAIIAAVAGTNGDWAG